MADSYVHVINKPRNYTITQNYTVKGFKITLYKEEYKLDLESIRSSLGIDWELIWAGLDWSGPDIRPGLYNRHLIIEGHRGIEGNKSSYRRSKKVMESHGIDILGKKSFGCWLVGWVSCRIILSAPVPFLFLWTLDFGLGFWTWIWGLTFFSIFFYP